MMMPKAKIKVASITKHAIWMKMITSKFYCICNLSCSEHKQQTSLNKTRNTKYNPAIIFICSDLFFVSFCWKLKTHFNV